MADLKPGEMARILKESRGGPKELARVRAEGKIEGRSEARKEVLDWFQKRYLDPKLRRDSEEAHAILKITREFCEAFPGSNNSRPL